jgi:hypothetical protein
MELKEDVAALRLSPSEVGILKEENLSKWLEGQEEWDRRFKHRAIKIIKQRKSYELKANSIIKSARARGLLLVGESDGLADRPTTGRLSSATICSSPKKCIQEDRRWGPLDLVGESPSPTAIAGRRDTVSRQFKRLLTCSLTICSQRHLLCLRRAFTTQHQ